MPRLTNVKSRADKRVMWIVGWDIPTEFPFLYLYPEESSDSRVTTEAVTKIGYNKDGTVKFVEDANTIYKFKPRPRGRPRRQDF